MAVRDAADGACWAGTDFRVCTRTVDKATSESRPADTPKLPEGRVQFIGRCHMDACTWLEQSGARQVGEGSEAVPGRLIEVTQRRAQRGYKGIDYPTEVPADATWEAAEQVQFFCSPKFPAVRETDGSWSVLPLPEVFGATEAATNAYAHACHPDVAGDDPYAAAEAMGDSAGTDTLGDSYPSFEALTAR